MPLSQDVASPLEPALCAGVDVSLMNVASTLLVIGGARSGKSAFAQAQAEGSELELVYVATAESYDYEMTKRIAAHVAARGPRWRTIDAPYDVIDVLRDGSASRTLFLVDCLTLWLSNLMLRGDDVEAATASLSMIVTGLAGPAIFVSNEVGAGIVPDNALARTFRDAQGRLNQAMAAACSHVVAVKAGLPAQLKPSPPLTPLFRD